MIGIVLERSYADIPEKILYKDSSGFADTIAKLTEIKEDAGNGGIEVETELTDVIRLFQEFQILDDEIGCLYYRWGGSAFIENPEWFIATFEDSECGSYKSDNVWKTWMSILRGLNEAIHEFYRYGGKGYRQRYYVPDPCSNVFVVSVCV